MGEESGKDGPNSGTRKDAGLKSGWEEFNTAGGRILPCTRTGNQGGRKMRLKGTGSREGSRAVRTWEERGENSGVRRELWKGERRIAGLRPDFDKMSPKFGWAKKREGGDCGRRVKGNRASGKRGAGCGCAQR